MKFAYLIEPPFNFRTESGVVTGCDVELAKYVSGELGHAHFELVEAEFSELLPGVADNRWRMTTGLFATPEREAMALFSRPIWALPDGLLVREENPRNLVGYHSIAANDECRLAVIRDQFQHRSAVAFGIPESRIRVFATYTEAATSVRNGDTDAYASVARAHAGFLERVTDWGLTTVDVPAEEKKPAFGSFAFSMDDVAFRDAVNRVLGEYLGSNEHRTMMRQYGFSDAEVDLICP